MGQALCWAFSGEQNRHHPILATGEMRGEAESTVGPLEEVRVGSPTPPLGWGGTHVTAAAPTSRVASLWLFCDPAARWSWARTAVARRENSGGVSGHWAGRRRVNASRFPLVSSPWRVWAP